MGEGLVKSSNQAAGIIGNQPRKHARYHENLSNQTASKPVLATSKDDSFYANLNQTQLAHLLNTSRSGSAVAALIGLLKLDRQEAKRFVPVLIKALGSDDELVSNVAFYVLGKLGLSAVPALIEELKGEASLIRLQVIQVLIDIGLPAVPALRAARENGNRQLRHGVFSVLSAIPTRRYLLKNQAQLEFGFNDFASDVAEILWCYQRRVDLNVGDLRLDVGAGIKILLRDDIRLGSKQIQFVPNARTALLWRPLWNEVFSFGLGADLASQASVNNRDSSNLLLRPHLPFYFDLSERFAISARIGVNIVFPISAQQPPYGFDSVFVGAGVSSAF